MSRPASLAVRFVRHPAAAIAAFAVVLVLPAMLRAPMTHDSFWIDWVWADQFTAELARGNIYPRWLPQSHGGLGSPVFYYYPPLAFHVAGLFGLLGLSTYASIIAAFLAGFAASGLAMFAWLRGSARSPLFGALLYMAMPYHLLDMYARGALAESLAIALLPLVAIGLRKAADGRILLAAGAYAGLILSHLPLALLASLFLIIPYSLWLSRGSGWALIRIALSLALGLGLAAIYLIPALSLESFRDSAALWNDERFRPALWTLLDLAGGAEERLVKSGIAIIILGLLAPIAILMLRAQRALGTFSLLCCALAAGLVPFVWSLPLLDRVQFPYRILPLAEFAIATGLANITLARAWLHAAILPLAVPSALFLAAFDDRRSLRLAELAASHPDVPENLPPTDERWEWPMRSRWALELSRDHREPRRDGKRIVDDVFYFPAWEVQCQGRRVRTAPDPATKLLSYVGNGCGRRLSITRAERIGAAISAVALLAVIAIAALGRRRRPRRRPAWSRSGLSRLQPGAVNGGVAGKPPDRDEEHHQRR